MSDITLQFCGNVASDPQQHLTGGNATLTTFRIASTERRFDKESNRWVDGHTSFLTVCCWRTLGEHVFASVHRGDPVNVQGRLKVRDWVKDDRRGTVVEVEATNVGHDLSRGTTVFQRRAAVASGLDPWEVAAITEQETAA